MCEAPPKTGMRYTVLLLAAICATAVSCVPDGRISPGEVIVTVEPSGPLRAPTGYLIVYTEARAFLDGDVSYYPHQPYRIYDEKGGFVQRVPNHRSNYDEKPTTVELPAGEYFVVPEDGGAARPRIGVVIKGGEVTKVDVESILKATRKP